MKQNIIFVLMAGILLLIASSFFAIAAQNKVELCHRPGTPAEHTIQVAESAIQAHLNHGDTIGACGDAEVCPFEDEYDLIEPIEVFFQITSESQDVFIEGIGADDGEGNFTWTFKDDDGNVIDSAMADDYIQLSWSFVDGIIPQGNYSIALQGYEGTAPKAELVIIACLELN
jgi:hypothetical protein